MGFRIELGKHSCRKEEQSQRLSAGRTGHISAVSGQGREMVQGVTGRIGHLRIGY